MIARLENEGMGALGTLDAPRPMERSRIDALRFPNGDELPPSLARWLAFDAAWLGWLDEEGGLALGPSPIARVAERAFGFTECARDFGVLEATLPADAYLLPKGTSARRILYTGAVDDRGEMPVLVLDSDGPPFVCIEAPGFDVYLATVTKQLFPPSRVFDGFFEDETYGPRMQQHADALFGGRRSLKLGDDGFTRILETAAAPDETLLLGPNDTLPEGYEVIEVVDNPFAGVPMRLAAPRKT